MKPEAESWAKLIRDLGFPVIVALWFMLRSDKRQDKIIDLIKDLIKNQEKKKK